MSASLLDYLKVFSLENKEDITLIDLKKAFHKKALEVHPDKGGEANDFDYLLNAYTYITNTICRVNGGRAKMEDIASPEELKAYRVKELNSNTNSEESDNNSEESDNNSEEPDNNSESSFCCNSSEYDEDDCFYTVEAANSKGIVQAANSQDTPESRALFLREFNSNFEKDYISDLNNGYSKWFSDSDSSDLNSSDLNSSDLNKKLEIGQESENGLLDYQQLLKQTPIPKSKDSELDNSIFIQEARKGKPDPYSIILHPNEMAYNSGTLIGTSLIGLGERPETYTSDFLSNPDFTDLYQAYTNENTICDKVSDNIITRSYDDILNERKTEVKPLTDEEKATLYEYERKQLKKEKQRIDKLNETYKTNYTYITTFLENKNIVCDEGSFIREIK